MMNKKGVAPIIIGLLILIGLAVAFQTGALEKIFSTSSLISSADFVKPLWGRLSCDPDPNGIQFLDRYLDQQTLFKCDGFTEQCDYTFGCVGAASTIGCGVTYKECDINGQNCGATTFTKTSIPPIKSGRSYTFIAGLFLNSYIHVKQTWTPYKLFRYTGARKDIINSYDCSLRTGDLSNVPKEDKVDRLNRQGGVGVSWINYVDDWAYGPATNVFTHPTYGQVYCSGGQIYKIVTIQMADGSLKKLDPTYKGTTDSGRSYNGLGSSLGSVECCPSEPNCGSNFKFVPVNSPDAGQNQPNSCYSDIQCYNAGGPVPIDSYHYVKYSCQGGTCVKSAETAVDCTTNAQCGAGQICDLSTMNYGKCITQKASFCGDSICNKVGGENYQNCPSDCAIDCPTGQQVIVKTSDTGPFCIGGYGLCDKSQIQYCGNPTANWLYWIVIIIIIGVLIYFAKPILMTIRGLIRR